MWKNTCEACGTVEITDQPLERCEWCGSPNIHAKETEDEEVSE